MWELHLFFYFFWLFFPFCSVLLPSEIVAPCRPLRDSENVTMQEKQAEERREEKRTITDSDLYLYIEILQVSGDDILIY